MKSTGRYHLRVLFVVAAFLASGSTAAMRAQDPRPVVFERDLLQGIVMQADDIDETAAESLFASAQAAIYFPDLRLARWFDVPGSSLSVTAASGADSATPKSLADFSVELERDFPGYRSSSHGRYMLKLPSRSDLVPSVAASALPPSSAATVLTDSFENGSLSQWDLANDSGGQYNFAPMGCKAHSGTWSADAVRGGAKGQFMFCSDGYPAGVTTQITHKTCDAIQGAGEAWLDFYLTAEMDDSERLGVYYLASDGYIWGYEFIGTWSSWAHVVVNLKQWYHVGDLTTLPCAKLIFQFKADGTATAGAGPQIDDVTIRTDAPPFLRCSINATPVSGPAPLAVSFVPSVGGASGGESYEWRFGDAAGTTSANRNAAFTYTAEGDYWARLRVIDANNIRGYAHVKIHVTAATGCSVACSASVPGTAAKGVAANFQASATASGCSGSPAFRWTFGDGQTSTQQNPAHSYVNAGSYNWTLTVSAGTATCAKSGTITVPATTGQTRRRSVVTRPAPVAVTVTIQPSAATLAPGARQTFRAKVAGSTNTAVTWSVAEGAAGGTVNAQGTYTAPSTYGIYHVVATSQAAPSRSSSAHVLTSPATVDSAYSPKPAAPATTSMETRSVTTTPNVKNTVLLGDGTKVEIPPLGGPITVTLTRETNTLDAVHSAGQETSGAMRTVTISGDPASLDFVPTITIPAAEAGSLSALNVARVGPVAQGGTLLNDRVMFLPATRDGSGNIVVRDIYLRGAARTAQLSAKSGLGIVKTIRAIWTASTYQGKINWAIEPQLVRMIPDAASAAKRKPLSALPQAQQEEILRKPVQNVIILVHGHNEMERYGFEAAETDAPWLMAYKRDVWTLLFDYFSSQYSAYGDCTAFYEYVYPSYRPVFEGSGERLGATLARLIADDPALKKLKNKYNLFFVAHSMGGLVTRSAVNQLSSSVTPNFEKLVTWGSPHHGSPVVTMRYLLTSGYNLDVPGMCFTGNWMPLETFNQFSLYHGFVKEEGAVDTPGERDLRWDNSKPLNLEGIGWKRAVWQEGDDVRWDPARNIDLYSSALADFNKADKYFLSDKYVALYGLTSSIAPIDLTSCSALTTFAFSEAIAQGNGINHWLYNNSATLGSSYPNSPAVKESDGAVPVDSMVGLGIFSAFNTYSLGDTDHEQYYGAPKNGSLTAKDKGDSTASWTLSRLKLKDAPNKQCDCPTLTIDQTQPGGSSTQVTATFKWPGDPKPGLRILGIASARGEGSSRVVTAARSYTAGEDGSIAATFDTATLTPTGGEKIYLLAQMKDGSESSAPVVQQATGLARTKFFNTSWAAKKTYIRHSVDGHLYECGNELTLCPSFGDSNRYLEGAGPLAWSGRSFSVSYTATTGPPSGGSDRGTYQVSVSGTVDSAETKLVTMKVAGKWTCTESFCHYGDVFAWGYTLSDIPLDPAMSSPAGAYYEFLLEGPTVGSHVSNILYSVSGPGYSYTFDHADWTDARVHVRLWEK